MKTALTKRIFTETNEVKKTLRFLCCLLLIVVAGCAVGPDYHRPDALQNQQLPKQFSDNNPTNATIWKIAEPSADLPRGEWWQLFNDAELNRLESLALTNNQNLVAAAARLEQSRALVSAARSEFYPQFTAGGTPGGDINRQRTSFNEPQNGQAAGVSHTYDTFTAPIYLGWELDLWGRVRRESQAAHERFVASADDLESAKLDVAAEVAVDYFLLRSLDNEYTLIANTIEDYRRSLELTQNRRRGGIVSDLDVSQAATQLHTAEVQLPDIELQRTQLRHALAVICGQSPVDFSISTNAQAAVVPGIPPNLPSELLEHRPDIAAAERRMAAANADVGVAKAAFFPTVRINGLAGFQSVDTSTWFDWPSRLWSVGPSIELPLFTGGLNRANLAAARAAYDETVANYRQTVLTAFGEVEDELAAQRLLANQWNEQNEAVIAARHTLEISNNRYKAGLVTYLDVATAQTDALNQERSAVQLQGARLTASVNLIKSLGCGWKQTEK
ncbi:MAG TPA: efflux transporter outer membrane subunit [Verrucomicrobiae bacterium]|nr:efflux transporter outer membrane subunit [Verrucomicrobiae bacterium]